LSCSGCAVRTSSILTLVPTDFAVSGESKSLSDKQGDLKCLGGPTQYIVMQHY